MTNGSSPGDPLETVASREDVLDALASADGGVAACDLVRSTDRSRSTVDRALRELAVEGFVERVDDGYDVSTAGRLALSQYRRCRDTVSSIANASDLLALVPDDAPVSAVMLEGATVHPSTLTTVGPAAHGQADLVTLIVERMEAADRVFGFTPVEPNPRIRRRLEERAATGDVDVEIVLTDDLARHLLSTDANQLGRLLERPSVGLLTVESLPYGLAVYERPDRTVVHLFPYGRTARIGGIVENDSPAAVEWAEAVHRQYRRRATPLEPPP